MEIAGGGPVALYGVGPNPYYNGRYSWSGGDTTAPEYKLGPNPYYNGRYSWSRPIVSVRSVSFLS